MFHSELLRRIQALEQRKAELAGPIDALSASLWEFDRELAALDEAGKLALVAQLDIEGVGLPEIERMCVDARRVMDKNVRIEAARRG